MADMSTSLKSELRRLAKKEIEAATGGIRKTLGQYGREIALLRRQLQQQRRKLALLEAAERKRLAKPSSAGHPSRVARPRTRVRPPLEQRGTTTRYPLRGLPITYRDPTAPVAEGDWEAQR